MGSDRIFGNPTFINRNIWKFLSSTEEWKRKKLYDSWHSFIKSKDFGIVCIDLVEDEYRVEDDKKWTLAKIKYGF